MAGYPESTVILCSVTEAEDEFVTDAANKQGVVGTACIRPVCGSVAPSDDESTPTHSSSFPCRLVWYLATHEADLTHPHSGLEEAVRAHVQDIVSGGQCGPLFQGKLLGCGSFHEHTKCSLPVEFDYLLELHVPDDVTFSYTAVTPPSTKLTSAGSHGNLCSADNHGNNKGGAVQQRSYFEVRVGGSATGEGLWGAAGSRDPQPLSAKVVQQMFLDHVTTNMAAKYGHHKQFTVQANGPAITLHLRVPPSALPPPSAAELLAALRRAGGREDALVVKVDIALALPCLGVKEGVVYPSHVLGAPIDPWVQKVQRNSPQGADLRVRPCLVPYGDLHWRLSFCRLESALVRRAVCGPHSRHVRATLLAVKHLRDKLAVTDSLQPQLLPTYPLKICFLKEVRRKNTSSDSPQHTDTGLDIPEMTDMRNLRWGFWEMGARVNSILRTVEDEGGAGTLTGCVLLGDAVLRDSDRCYLECRRIRRYLAKQQDDYNFAGLLHTVILSVLLLSHTICLTSGGVGGANAVCYSICAVIFVVNITGLSSFFVTKRRSLMHDRNMVYVMNTSVGVVYIVMLFIHIIYISCLISSSIGAPEPVQKVTRTLCVVISSVIIAITLLHLAIVCILTRGRLQFYCWEWIFFDQLYLSVWKRMWKMIPCAHKAELSAWD